MGAMNCKVCNTKFTSIPNPMFGLSLSPNCKCGRVRTRERKKGCPKCGRTGMVILLLKKNWRGYHFDCSCGHKWRVRE